jgi:quinol---cytochrome-c reductase cytochrome c subunit
MTRALAAAALAAALAAGAASAGPVQRGRHLFGAYCAACHGEAAASTIGAGPGRAQEQQHVSAPSLDDVGAIAADFYLRTGYMPLRQAGDQPRRRRVHFDEQQIRDLVAYVASLGPGPAIPKPHAERGNLSLGQKLFSRDCAGCHQIAARGGYVTDAVPPPLDEATPTEIAEAVRIGPYVMPRFPPRALSNHQLDSIVAYVDYARSPDDRGGWSIGNLGPVPEGIVTWFLAAAALVAVCVVIGRRRRA